MIVIIANTTEIKLLKVTIDCVEFIIVEKALEGHACLATATFPSPTAHLQNVAFALLHFHVSTWAIRRLSGASGHSKPLLQGPLLFPLLYDQTAFSWTCLDE